MKILLTGDSGQVGSNILELAKNQHEVKALDIEKFDFSQPEKLKSALEKLVFKPDIFINPAAYTAVDKAETEKELCDNINNKSVAVIAEYCRKNNIFLVHYSTDYVFNGSGNQSFSEDNVKDLQPLNYYGKTKLEGERAIQNAGCNYIILRTSWVYNHIGSNFVLTILKLMSEREELKIVNDQIGSPTYAYDIAEATLKVIEKIDLNATREIYNLCPSEQLSWYDFVLKIKKIAENKGYKFKINSISGIPSYSYPTPAIRPLNSRLDVSKLKRQLGIELPEVDLSLSACIGRAINI
ncbi:MAG TPA: dTDP-4-dehydrorhamnose reductase [Alphaproteobacteria bacterium]|nr:dTDP-4-dehydrorhamnose reductase [Alphaproteobacteria bacterium]